jgi:hypothetical protein
MSHFTDGKNRDVAGVRLDHFNCADGPVWMVRIDVHDHDFRAHVLHLAQNRICGAAGKPGMTEDIPAHAASLQTMLEYRQPFPVFGEKGYRYALHRHDLVTCLSMLLRNKGYAK